MNPHPDRPVDRRGEYLDIDPVGELRTIETHRRTHVQCRQAVDGQLGIHARQMRVTHIDGQAVKPPATNNSLPAPNLLALPMSTETSA